MPGYLDDAGPTDSHTETFVALKAEIDNWRWAGVPFYLRTGKRLRHARARRSSSQFQPVPHSIFPGSDGAADHAEPAGASGCSPTRACACT